MGKIFLLAYFAERPDGPLKHLNDEATAIREYCHDSDLTMMERWGDMASVKQLIKDLETYGEKIVAFHYSGHADGQNLFFASGTGDGEGLANLFEKCKNLKFIFLNGCSTWDHIENFAREPIKTIIATRYAVRDKEAYRFSASFYQHLFSEKKTIHESFQDATIAFAVDANLKNLLPDSLRRPKNEIVVESFRGFAQKKADSVAAWGLFSHDEKEPILYSGKWMPVQKHAINRARAYTCGRKHIKSDFIRHYQEHAEVKKVLHYIVVEDVKNSPMGLSIKLLFESITNTYDEEESKPFYYPCDPDEDDFEQRVIRLEADRRSKGEIIDKIYRDTSHPRYKGQVSKDNFENLYEIAAFQQRKQVFIFLELDEIDFDVLKQGVHDVIEESLNLKPADNSSRPQLIFFWHILSEEKKSFFQFTNFRKSVANYFHRLKNSSIFYLHENYLKPFRPLEQNDFAEWMTRNQIIKDRNKAKSIFDQYQKEVYLMEMNLRDLIKKEQNLD